MSFTGILFLIIAFLIATLFGVFAVNGAANRRKERREQERRKKHEQRTARIHQEAARRNESMETGDSTNDFDASIGVLQEFAGRNKRNKPPDSPRPDSKRAKHRNVRP